MERTLVCLFHVLNNHRAGSSQRIRHAISLNILPCLLRILTSPSSATLFDIQQNVLCILTNIGSDGDFAIKMVLEANPIPILLKVDVTVYFVCFD